MYVRLRVFQFTYCVAEVLAAQMLRLGSTQEGILLIRFESGNF
jgi:hypothetical protein